VCSSGQPPRQLRLAPVIQYALRFCAGIDTTERQCYLSPDMKTFTRAHPPDRSGIASRRGLPRRRSGFSRSHLSWFAVLSGILAWGIVGQVALAATPAASAASINGANAELNGVRMASGATLFPGDVVQLGASSTVALQFGKNLVFATSLTELVVGPAGVSLRSGRIQVRAGSGASFAVSGPFFNLNIASPAGGASSVEIRVGGTQAQVSTIAGAAELIAAGSNAHYNLHAGETATLDATTGSATAEDAATAGPQASQDATKRAAGKVSSLVPQVQIDRSSVTSVAGISTQVFWNDDLRSGPTGRARVALNDGSLLNLGSNSEMRVVQHDAKAQQTTLDLTIGRMRGQVVKLTRPGSKFEIRTPMGVAGLVGTDFSLFVTSDRTELMVFEGVVRFTPILNGPAVTVTAGMKILISRLGTIEGPSSATPDEIQTAQNLTNAPKVPVQSVSIPGAQASVMPTVIVSVAAGAAVIGIGAWQDTRNVVSPQNLNNGTPNTVVQ
jgi:ferric-dicitrate binding protein FerR (iron transport regulator)